MARVNKNTTINASAAEVWTVMSDFNGLGKFVAAVADSSLEGAGIGCTRTLTLQDGATIVERLESLDQEEKQLEYAILSGPLPVDNYLSKMAVKEVGSGQCEVSWSSTFDPKGASEQQAVEAIEGIYEMGFEGLKKLFP